MGKLIVTEYVTLDGVAQAGGGPEEDRSGGFGHGGWMAPFAEVDSAGVVFEQASAMGALLLGRRTYDIFAGFWPTAPAEVPWTGLLNRVPRYVATRTLVGPLAWEGASVLTGDLATAVGELTARHDEVHVIGSLDLLQSLLRLRLVGRLSLWVYPLVLGAGKRVFGDGTVPTTLRLADATTYGGGVAHLTYEPVGPVTYGDLSARG